MAQNPTMILSGTTLTPTSQAQTHAGATGAGRRRRHHHGGNFLNDFVTGFKIPFKKTEDWGINDVLAQTPLAPAASIYRGINKALGQGNKRRHHHHKK